MFRFKRKPKITFINNMDEVVKQLDNYHVNMKRIHEINYAAIQLGKSGLSLNDIYRIQKRISKDKQMKEKKTIYFKECTQELLETPINDKNCYYVGELKPKVIKRIESLLKDKSLSHDELMKLLKFDKKFRFKYEWHRLINHQFRMLTNYTKQKGKPTLYYSIPDINTLQ